MIKSVIETMYAYSKWANWKVCDVVEELSPDQFAMSLNIGTSFPSIRQTLIHIINAQQYWLDRVNQVELTPFHQFEEFADIATVRSVWEDVEKRTWTFISNLTDEDFFAEIHYMGRGNVPSSYSIWEAMLHQVNHATQHRSEISAMLTYLEHSPGDWDFAAQLDQLRNKPQS